MNDLIVTARSVPKGRWTLEDLVEITKGASMKLKPPKSRILVLRRGSVWYRPEGPREQFQDAGSCCQAPLRCRGLVDETAGTWGENPAKPQGLKHMAPPPVVGRASEGSDLYANNPPRGAGGDSC